MIPRRTGLRILRALADFPRRSPAFSALLPCRLTSIGNAFFSNLHIEKYRHTPNVVEHHIGCAFPLRYPQPVVGGPSTITKCLKLRHFQLFPQIDAAPI